MNPYPITSPDPLGLPASVEFILVFKVLGFVLHVIPMNIFYVGVPLSIMLAAFGRGNARRIGLRLIRPMPIVIALGVNFGIVPLLFTQVLLYPHYYTAGILIAWPWLSVIVLLLLAYYGVYLYSYQARKESLTALGYVAGWMSGLFFIVIGFLFSNNFSLMTNADQWLRIYAQSNDAGAVTGLALNTGDPTLIPRCLLMIGIAITTTAVWLLIDNQFFSPRESEEYRKFLPGFSLILYSIGIVWMGVAGAWYILKALPHEIYDLAMNTPWVKVSFGIAGFSALVPWLWILLKRKSMNRFEVWVAVILQMVVIVSNAISRQWVQVAEIERTMLLHRDPVNLQWSSIIVFLLLLTCGVLTIVWMVRRILAVSHDQPVVDG